MNIIGQVSNKDCILIDDICDTAGTLTNAANALKIQKRQISLCIHYSWRFIKSCYRKNK